MEGDKGQEVYRRQEARFSGWREVAEIKKIMQHCAITCNQKSAKRLGGNKNRVGNGIKRYRKWEV